MSRKTTLWAKKYSQGFRARGKEGAWSGLFPDRRVRSIGRRSVKKLTESGEVSLLPGIASDRICSEAMDSEKAARVRRRVEAGGSR